MKGNTRKIILRILGGVLLSVVLVYVVFLFVTTNFLGNNTIVTETANRTVAYDVIKTTAMIVRDEDYISSDKSGVLVYNISDGDKVTANGAVASVYQDQEDVINMQRISDIEEKLAQLETLNSVNASVNVGIDTVNSQLNEKLITLIGCVNNRAFELVQNAEDDLMSSIFRKQIITGEQLSFEDKIEELEQEREELRRSTVASTGEVTSKSAGYFVSKVDGYEKAFDASKVEEITYKDLKSAQAENIDSGNYIGKVINGINWYLLCPVSSDEAVSIAHTSSTVSVRMPYALSAEIPAKVYSVNQFSDEEKAMLVLECNFMSDALSKIRQESVEIVVNSYEGLKVKKSALHDDYVEKVVTNDAGEKTTEKQKVQGVYVNYGNELIFKQVSILYAGDDYVICDESPDSELLFNGSTVTLYDQVVTEGSDLFNGKLLD